VGNESTREVSRSLPESVQVDPVVLPSAMSFVVFQGLGKIGNKVGGQNLIASLPDE
jgi:hypothetical protein